MMMNQCIITGYPMFRLQKLFFSGKDYALNTVPHGLRPSYEYLMGLQFLTARYPRGPVPKSKTFKPQTFF